MACFLSHSFTKVYLACVLVVFVLATDALAVPPTAPSNMTSTYTQANSTTLYWRLEWMDNSTDEGGFTIGYRINNGASWVEGTLGSFDVNAATKTSTGPLSLPINLDSHFGWYQNNGNWFPYPGLQFFVTAFKGTAANPTEPSAPANGPQYSSSPGTQTATLGAPTNLAVTPGGDGHFRLTWNDNSNSEYYFEVNYKKTTDSTWQATGVDFNFTSQDIGGYKSRTAETDMFLPNFLPGTSYDFKIRAVDFNNTPSAFTSVVSASTQAFKAPTGLAATRVGESTFDLSFSNNSTAESGYHFQYRVQGSSTWLDLGKVDSPYFSIINTGTMPPGTIFEFQARAYIRGSNTSTAEPILYTSFTTPVATGTTLFNAPTNLQASATSERQINLTWTDNSGAEQGYAVYYKTSSSSSYVLYDYTAANVTTYSFTGLDPGTIYNFQVAAAYQATSVIESARSNTATATTKDGFTSPSFITFGTNNTYTYQATTSSATSTRTSFNTATGLPAGMSFNTSTGAITGTPTQFGLFTVTLSATFSDGRTVTTPVTLRIARPPAAPTIVSALPSTQTLVLGGGAATVSLAGKFADQDTESAVRLVTTKGNVDVLLYPTATPTTVTNFLGYVGRGDYDNSAFHRISDLASSGVVVLQGGQVKPSSAGATAFTAITAQSAIQNEPGISNLNYTIAMAKSGGNPNSATKEFYFNLTDLNSVLDPSSMNGGFTVFGRVSNATKSSLDALSTAPAGGPYTTLVDGTSTNTGFKWPMNVASAAEVPATMDNTKVMTIISASTITQTLTNSATSSAPAVATVAVVGSDLIITPVGPGETTVTVTATDLDGMTATQSITVTVNQAPVFSGTSPSSGTYGAPYSFACTASGSPAPSFSVTAGALPSGLTLSSTGVISGTPTAAGTFTGTLSASNGIGTADTLDFSIIIEKAAAGVTLNGLAAVYDGSPKPVSVVTTPAGLAVNVTYDGSGTAPSAHGSHAVVATIDDPNHMGVQSGTLVIGGQPAASWRTQHFTTEEISLGLAADDADADGDGVKNLFEYALGTDPRVRNAALTPIRDANGLTLVFTRPKNLPGVTYMAESTDSFGVWNPVALEVITDGPVQTVRARDPLSSGNPGRRFIRLVVTPVP